MENKNNEKKLIIIIIAFAVIALCLIGYICYDTFFTNNNSNNNEQVNEEEPKEAVSIEDKIVIDAMNHYEDIYISSNELYRADKYDIKNMSNYDLVANAIRYLDDENIAFCVHSQEQLKEPISYDDINTELKKHILDKQIFVETISSLESTSSYPLGQYEVNGIGIIIKENGIQLIGPCGVEGAPEDYVNRKIVSAEKQGDYLYVYEKQAFAKHVFDDTYDVMSVPVDFVVDYYKDYNKKEVVEKNLYSRYNSNSCDENSTIKCNPNWDLYNTYKYTFKLFEGKYHFEGFELNK